MINYIQTALPFSLLPFSLSLSFTRRKGVARARLTVGVLLALVRSDVGVFTTIKSESKKIYAFLGFIPFQEMAWATYYY